MAWTQATVECLPFLLKVSSFSLDCFWLFIEVANQEFLEFQKIYTAHLARVILISLKHVLFKVWYERILFPVWISLSKISEFAGNLPRRLIQFCQLGVESITADPGAR